MSAKGAKPAAASPVLCKFNHTDRKGLKTMNEFNLCYTVLLGKPAGANIGIIKRGERGFTPTWLDWGTGDKAAELVREANARRGIDAATQLDFEIKSMFVWPKAEAVEAPAMADDGDDWEPDDSPREPLQFIPHASDYSRFD